MKPFFICSRLIWCLFLINKFSPFYVSVFCTINNTYMFKAPMIGVNTTYMLKVIMIGVKTTFMGKGPLEFIINSLYNCELMNFYFKTLLTFYKWVKVRPRCVLIILKATNLWNRLEVMNSKGARRHPPFVSWSATQLSSCWAWTCESCFTIQYCGNVWYIHLLMRVLPQPLRVRG